MSTLGQKPATQHVSLQKQTITGNGGTSYTLQQSVGSALDIAVFVNNTRQEPTTAYTATGTTLTMTGAVNSSDHFYVIFLGKAIATTGLPVDIAIAASTVTTSQTITSTGNITTSGTINTPSINSGQIGGRRNIVINGAMQFAQRGTSFTSVAGSAYHLDRYRTGMGDTSARFTVTQATAGLNGFGNSLKYDCTTAESSLSNADARLFVTQRIEGQDLQQLKKGTSDAEKFTVSFYVKSTKTGTYILNIVDIDNNRQISQAYTISSSGTWEQKTLTFDGDTTGALGNDNGNSFELHWWLIAGTNYSSGSLATSWTTYAGASDYAKSAVGNVNLGDNTSNTWEITGIQMEVGEQATPFEHRPFAEELQLCKRYFQVLADGSRSQNEAICAGTYYTASILFHSVVLPVEMRSQPTMVTTNGTNYYITFANGGGDHHDAIARSGNSSKSVVEITAETNVSGTAGHACFTRIGGTSSDAKCMFDAEL